MKYLRHLFAPFLFIAFSIRLCWYWIGERIHASFTGYHE